MWYAHQILLLWYLVCLIHPFLVSIEQTISTILPFFSNAPEKTVSPIFGQKWKHAKAANFGTHYSNLTVVAFSFLHSSFLCQRWTDNIKISNFFFSYPWWKKCATIFLEIKLGQCKWNSHISVIQSSNLTHVAYVLLCLSFYCEEWSTFFSLSSDEKCIDDIWVEIMSS